MNETLWAVFDGDDCRIFTIAGTPDRARGFAIGGREKTIPEYDVNWQRLESKGYSVRPIEIRVKSELREPDLVEIQKDALVVAYDALKAIQTLTLPLDPKDNDVQDESVYYLKLIRNMRRIATKALKRQPNMTFVDEPNREELLDVLKQIQAWAEQANPAGYGGLPANLRTMVDSILVKSV